MSGRSASDSSMLIPTTLLSVGVFTLDARRTRLSVRAMIIFCDTVFKRKLIGISDTEVVFRLQIFTFQIQKLHFRLQSGVSPYNSLSMRYLVCH